MWLYNFSCLLRSHYRDSNVSAILCLYIMFCVCFTVTILFGVSGYIIDVYQCLYFILYLRFVVGIFTVLYFTKFINWVLFYPEKPTSTYLDESNQKISTKSLFTDRILFLSHSFLSCLSERTRCRILFVCLSCLVQLCVVWGRLKDSTRTYVSGVGILV